MKLGFPGIFRSEEFNKIVTERLVYLMQNSKISKKTNKLLIARNNDDLKKEKEKKTTLILLSLINVRGDYFAVITSCPAYFSF